MVFRNRLISPLRISFPFFVIHGNVNVKECSLFLPAQALNHSLPSFPKWDVGEPVLQGVLPAAPAQNNAWGGLRSETTLLLDFKST